MMYRLISLGSIFRSRIRGALRTAPLLLASSMISLAAVACAQTEGPVIYVTATFEPTPLVVFQPNPEFTARPNPFVPTPLPSFPTPTPIQPTPNLAPPINQGSIAHAVEEGESLGTIAFAYGTDIATLLSLNPGLTESAILTPGQELTVPARPAINTPDFKLIPDSELVNSPGARGFDPEAYIDSVPGFIRAYTENVFGLRMMTSAEIVQFHAQAASVNPRLILALLEYRGGWVTQPAPDIDAITYPMAVRRDNQSGLFRQVAWAVNQLNEGYYGWKTRGTDAIELNDGQRRAIAPGLNGGTVGVQAFLAATAATPAQWEYDVSPQGFFQTYLNLFGDPFRLALEPLVPVDLRQPDWTLPFPAGETWFITAGPHGGWDATASGWSAVDFAPPSPPPDIAAQGSCFVSDRFATAMAAGIVVRSGDGVVAIDLDMDNDERTGWVLIYLHIADADRAPVGTVVQPGTPIGRPSCEGFYLNAGGTHIHVARRYNGEWIVADCAACLMDVAAPPFVMSGWTLMASGRVWQGWLERDGQVRRALTGRDDPTNQISW